MLCGRLGGEEGGNQLLLDSTRAGRARFLSVERVDVPLCRLERPPLLSELSLAAAISAPPPPMHCSEKEWLLDMKLFMLPKATGNPVGGLIEAAGEDADSLTRGVHVLSCPSGRLTRGA